MKRVDVEEYLNKNVEITLYDGMVLKGELHKTGEDIFKDNPDLYIRRNYYTLVDTGNPQSWIFRCSHIKKIKAFIPLEKEPSGMENEAHEMEEIKE